MKDILQEIVAHKRIEVEAMKEAVSLELMLQMKGDQLNLPRKDMRKALEASDSGIIAEFKRKSPSKGWLHAEAKVKEVLPAYQLGGASASSILTDNTYFGGTLRDLSSARQSCSLPLLRKDFMIDEYQFYQAKILCADTILLIAACLSQKQCEVFAHLAHQLDLGVLLEIHNEKELAYVNEDIDMLGINNRDLGSFHTDIAQSFRLAEKMKETISYSTKAPLLVSESGITKPEDIRELRQIGFRGFLIGETFMKTEQPGHTLKNFIQRI